MPSPSRLKPQSLLFPYYLVSLFQPLIQHNSIQPKHQVFFFPLRATKMLLTLLEFPCLISWSPVDVMQAYAVFLFQYVLGCTDLYSHFHVYRHTLPVFICSFLNLLFVSQQGLVLSMSEDSFDTFQKRVESFFYFQSQQTCSGLVWNGENWKWLEI